MKNSGPSAAVHIVIYQSGVIVPDGGGSIEQDRQQVLPDVADPGGVLLQTVEHICFRVEQTVSTISSTISSSRSQS